MLLSPKPHNPIAQRLETMSGMWEEFTSMPESKICRWLVAEDEYQMVNGFFELQASEGGEIPDLFLKFEAPFEFYQGYGQALKNEFTTLIKSDLENLKEEGFNIDWKPLSGGSKNWVGAQLFLNNLQSFAESLEDLEGFIVAYISPKKNKSIVQWEQWFLEAIQIGVPDKVKLMIADMESYEVFGQIAQSYPEQVMTIRPNLDMPSAMRQIAGQGNPSDPAVKFRRAFVNLTQVVGKGGNIKEIEKLGNNALSIAKANKWPQMQVVVFSVIGGAYFGKKDYTGAVKVYEKAKQVAIKAKKAGDPSAGKLILQTNFSQGAALLTAKNYPEAASIYEQSVAIAKENEDTFNELEAWRMAAYCHEGNYSHKRAWDCYNQALKVGEKLDEKMRKNSTLPYVGEGLMRLLFPLKLYNHEHIVQQQMVDLVGPDWQSKLTPKANAK